MTIAKKEKTRLFQGRGQWRPVNVMRNYLGNIPLYRDIRFDSGTNYHNSCNLVKYSGLHH